MFDKFETWFLELDVVLERIAGKLHNGVVCHFKTTNGKDVRYFYSYYYMDKYIGELNDASVRPCTKAPK